VKKLQFKVKWQAKINGEIFSGIEETSSWYFIDQRGNFYSCDPLGSFNLCDMDTYTKLTPIIKINNEFLTIEEIEERLKYY